MGPKEFILSCCREEGDIVVKKYLIDGESYFFSKLGEPYGEFHLKKDIAAALKVHIRDIVIVGSAKLGFSIKPQIIDKNIFYPFKEFDSQCNKDPDAEPSDIDIAIVSDKLFNEQLENLYEYTQGYKSYNRGDGKHDKLADYILKGWLRPDCVPRRYCISTGINKVLEEYRKKYKRKVNIGIYKSWFFFENYHKNNIQNIKLNHISNI